MALTFSRSKKSAFNDYFVLSDEGSFLGFVRRVEDWTVRGTRVSWEAYLRHGKYLGRSESRKAAAAILSNPERIDG